MKKPRYFVIILICYLTACKSNLNEKVVKENKDNSKSKIIKESLLDAKFNFKIEHVFENNRDSIFINQNEKLIYKFRYTLPDNNTFFDSSSIIVFDKFEIKQHNYFVLGDSILLLPLNDINGRKIINGINILNRKSLNLDEKDYYLSSRGRIFYDAFNQLLYVINSSDDQHNILLIAYKINSSNFVSTGFKYAIPKNQSMEKIVEFLKEK